MTADERSIRVLEDSEVERALVVTAHPDDADFGAAGTISGWTAAGIEVTYCVCTDGDAGGFDPPWTGPTSLGSGGPSSRRPARQWA
jgi:LmbE family N-acetylglucosaminyl deacetylase